MRLQFANFGLGGAGELRIFTLEEDGSQTQIGNFFALENGKISGGFNTEFFIDRSLLSRGAQLQFELVSNGGVRTGALEVQDDLSTVIDFGNDTRLAVALTDEAATPNLLREDATTIDLTGFDGSDVTLNFSVYREASYDSTLGFYRTDTADGGIRDAVTGDVLRAGDEGYREAALSRQLDVQLTGENGEMKSFSSTIDGGSFLGMFLISDGSDASSGDVLFSAVGANSGTDYAKMLGNNTFGFEDIVGGGDRDFNDMVVSVDFA